MSAVTTIRPRLLWPRYDGGGPSWEKQRYPDARDLFITADAGGSNGYRARAWKHRLHFNSPMRRVCASTSSHFPPGTSKWNKIEHRLFCHITQKLARQAAT